MVNFVIQRAFANLLSEYSDDVITYVKDTAHFYWLDGTYTEVTNLYFTESFVKLKDQMWDIFEFSEKEISFYEYTDSKTQYRTIESDVKTEDRVYLQLFLRNEHLETG